MYAMMMTMMVTMMMMMMMMMTATQPGARERAGQEEATRKCESVSAAPGGRYIGQLTYNVCVTPQTMLLSSLELIWTLISAK